MEAEWELPAFQYLLHSPYYTSLLLLFNKPTLLQLQVLTAELLTHLLALFKSHGRVEDELVLPLLQQLIQPLNVCKVPHMRNWRRPPNNANPRRNTNE